MVNLQSIEQLIIPKKETTEWEEETIEIPSLVSYVPSILRHHIETMVTVSKATDEMLLMAMIPTLTSLASGTRVSRSFKESSADPMILYTAAFMSSGAGKSDAINRCKDNFIMWLEREHKYTLAFITKEIRAIDKKLDNLKKPSAKATEAEQTKFETDVEILETEKDRLMSLIPPDLFLDGGTVEGFEEAVKGGASLLWVIDEFGDFVLQAKRNEAKASTLTNLKTSYDGHIQTKRLRGSGRSQNITLKGLGVYAASTIGSADKDSLGLTPSNMMALISDGTLNRFLVAVDTEYKDIPKRKYLDSKEAFDIELFARCFRAYATDRRFDLTDKARDEYNLFIDHINNMGRRKTFRSDNTVGQTVRQPNALIRIAALFHIASKCLEIRDQVEIHIGEVKLAMKEERELPILEIDSSIIDTAIQPESVKQAREFLHFMENKHFSKIFEFTRRAVSREDKYILAIGDINIKGGTANLRSIYRKLHMKRDPVERELDYMIESKHIGLEDGVYFILNDKGLLQ